MTKTPFEREVAEMRRALETARQRERSDASKIRQQKDMVEMLREQLAKSQEIHQTAVQWAKAAAERADEAEEILSILNNRSA